MDLLIIIFLMIIIYKASFSREEYMSKEYCNCLRGIFSIIIVFVHISYGRNEFTLFDSLKFFGQFIVGCFFFLSGFGLYLQYKNKGKKEFSKGYLEKRVFLLLKKYFEIYLLYLVVIFILRLIGYMPSQNIQSFFIIPKSWFIFIIIVLYINFYFSVKYVKSNLIIWITIQTILLYLFLLIIDASDYYYVSLFAFPSGMLFYEIKDKLKNDFLYFFILFIIFVFSEYVQFVLLNETNIFEKIIKSFLQNVGVVSCVFIIFRIGKYIKFKNNITKFLGSISLEIYLIHPIYEILFQRIEIINNNSFLYGVMVLAFTILTSIFYNKKNINFRR